MCSRVDAQPALKPTPLGPATASAAEEFQHIISVRELSSGRVLVSDNRDKRIVSVDFRTNSSRELGRAGDGPGEFRTVGRLWDIGSDSTLMAVPYMSRLIILHRDSIVSTVTGQQGIVLALGGTLLKGADARGNVLKISYGSAPAREALKLDSFFVERINRKDLKKDVVTRIANTDKNIVPVAGRPTGGGVPAGKQVYNISLTSREQIAMFPDGSIAMLRGNPYRVDWCMTASATCANGANQLFAARRWVDADKKAYLTQQNASGAWPPTKDINEVAGWPEQIIPFETPGGPDDANFWPTALGNVVVERAVNSSTSVRTYDVISRQSKLIAVITVAADQRIIGFGKGTVYVIRKDADDIQRLERHAWAY